MTTKLPVPNHVIDTNSFNRLEKNSVAKVTPSIIHFKGFTPGKEEKRILKICNISSGVEIIHIIPPQTSHFKIKYEKKSRFIAGTILKIELKFLPDKWDYFHDFIRIFCSDKDHLVVPIHAFPVIDTSEFPKNISFSVSGKSLGQTFTRKINIHSKCPINFQFQILILQSHPSFSVTPSSGEILGNSSSQILITYHPTEYMTSYMKLQLTTSQFASLPLICDVTGVCSCHTTAPTSSVKPFLDPITISPLQIARRRNIQQTRADDVIVNELTKSKEFSQRRDNQLEHERAILDDVTRERTNQLKWQIRRGDDVMSAASRDDVLKKRREAQINENSPKLEIELQRRSNEKKNSKSKRLALMTSSTVEKSFNLYANESWSLRHRALFRFRQAAEIILLRHRVDLRLKKLRKEINEKHMTSLEKCDDVMHRKKSDDVIIQTFQQSFDIAKTDHVLIDSLSAAFVGNNSKSISDDVIETTTNNRDNDVITWQPFHQLVVESLFRMKEYEEENIGESFERYISPKLSRPLRKSSADPNLPKDIESSDDPLPLLHPPNFSLAPPGDKVFNRSPGVLAYHLPLPLSIIDRDYYVTPHRHQLPDDDVMRDLTSSWKRFASFGMRSLNDVNTLIDLWLPRHHHRNELMTSFPRLLDTLPVDDERCCVDDVINPLTPEMIAANFVIDDVTDNTENDVIVQQLPRHEKLEELEVLFNQQHQEEDEKEDESKN